MYLKYCQLHVTIIIALAFLVTSCRSDYQAPCACYDSLDCPNDHFCDEDACECHIVDCGSNDDCPEGTCCSLNGYCLSSIEQCAKDCRRDDECMEMGPCMECVDRRCRSFACKSDADCPDLDGRPRICFDYDDEVGCRTCIPVDCGGGSDELCADPTFPLYVECDPEDVTKCINGQCQCRPPCGGACPDGQYCCRQTQTCDPLPMACFGVECPEGEQVNPDPGGTLNEETCAIEEADCSCVPAHECGTGGNSTLPGVSIGFPTQTCVYTLAEAAAGIEFDYYLTMEEDLPGVTSAPMDWGQCGSPYLGGLWVMEYVSGGDQHYCICDFGLCQPQDWPEGTLPQGSYPESFSWDGRNWIGPSDYMNPKGDPFPPGEYTVSVVSRGTWVTPEGETVYYEVIGTFVLHLVP